MEENEFERFLESFEKDHMIDDHGDMIIGSRDKPPVEREEKKN